jgi:hypothetical protein
LADTESFATRPFRTASDPNICEGKFFNRYFTLGFPLGDARDLDVRGDLESLAI